jgi:hypothetical protein
VHGRELLVKLLDQRTLLAAAGYQTVSLQLQLVVAAHLLGQSLVVADEQGGQ